MVSYWAIILEEQVFNQMRTVKFKEASLKGKCKMLENTIQEIESNKHQSDLKEPVNLLEHTN